MRVVETDERRCFPGAPSGARSVPDQYVCNGIGQHRMLAVLGGLLHRRASPDDLGGLHRYARGPARQRDSSVYRFDQTTRDARQPSGRAMDGRASQPAPPERTPTAPATGALVRDARAHADSSRCGSSPHHGDVKPAGACACTRRGDAVCSMPVQYVQQRAGPCVRLHRVPGGHGSVRAGQQLVDGVPAYGAGGGAHGAFEGGTESVTPSRACSDVLRCVSRIRTTRCGGSTCVRGWVAGSARDWRRHGTV